MKRDSKPNRKQGMLKGYDSGSGGVDSNAKSALDGYYDDLLGSISDDPLSKLREQEERSKILAAKQSAEQAPIAHRSSEPKSKQALPKLKTAFAEESSTDLVSSVVIPAAFPKLAPKVSTKPSSKAETKTKEELKEECSPPSQETFAPDSKKVQPKVDVEIQPEHADSENTSADEQSLSEIQNAHNRPKDWLSNGRPEWGQERFECLLFSVAGLKLAVPLISLGAIYKIEDDFTPIVGRADWFMGMYKTTDRNVSVVDTAKWVMPDRYREGVREGYKFVIRLGGNNWGVACDDVYEAIQLEPTQVKWRTERSKRPWLSGTVVEHMCALLDADTLSYLLQQDIRIH